MAILAPPNGRWFDGICIVCGRVADQPKINDPQLPFDRDAKDDVVEHGECDGNALLEALFGKVAVVDGAGDQRQSALEASVHRPSIARLELTRGFVKQE